MLCDDIEITVSVKQRQAVLDGRMGYKAIKTLSNCNVLSLERSIDIGCADCILNLFLIYIAG